MPVTDLFDDHHHEQISGSRSRNRRGAWLNRGLVLELALLGETEGFSSLRSRSFDIQSISLIGPGLSTPVRPRDLLRCAGTSFENAAAANAMT